MENLINVLVEKIENYVSRNILKDEIGILGKIHSILTKLQEILFRKLNKSIKNKCTSNNSRNLMFQIDVLGRKYP